MPSSKVNETTVGAVAAPAGCAAIANAGLTVPRSIAPITPRTRNLLTCPPPYSGGDRVRRIDHSPSMTNGTIAVEPADRPTRRVAIASGSGQREPAQNFVGPCEIRPGAPAVRQPVGHVDLE